MGAARSVAPGFRGAGRVRPARRDLWRGIGQPRFPRNTTLTTCNSFLRPLGDGCLPAWLWCEQGVELCGEVDTLEFVRAEERFPVRVREAKVVEARGEQFAEFLRVFGWQRG